MCTNNNSNGAGGLDSNAPKGSVNNPYTQVEYESMLAAGTWTEGYVEGMGYVLPEVVVTPSSGGGYSGSDTDSSDPWDSMYEPSGSTSDMGATDCVAHTFIAAIRKFGNPNNLTFEEINNNINAGNGVHSSNYGAVVDYYFKVDRNWKWTNYVHTNSESIIIAITKPINGISHSLTIYFIDGEGYLAKDDQQGTTIEGCKDELKDFKCLTGLK